MSTPPMDFIPHASTRLAPAIVRVSRLPHDPRTFLLWAEANHVTVWLLHSWCRSAGVSGREVLNFARLLRAVNLSAIHRCGCEELLDVADPKVMARLLRQAGVCGFQAGTVSVDQFLVRQSFVVRPVLLRCIKELLDGQRSSSDSRQMVR